MPSHAKLTSLNAIQGRQNTFSHFDEIWTRKNLTTFGLKPLTTTFETEAECEYSHSKGNCPLFRMPYVAKSYNAWVASYLAWKLGVTFFWITLYIYSRYLSLEIVWPRFHGHLKPSLMPLSGVLKIAPRFHGHIKASLKPLSGVIKLMLPIETLVIHVPVSGRVGGTLPHKSYNSLSWVDQTANGRLRGQSPRPGLAVPGPVHGNGFR